MDSVSRAAPFAPVMLAVGVWFVIASPVLLLAGTAPSYASGLYLVSAPPPRPRHCSAPPHHPLSPRWFDVRRPTSNVRGSTSHRASSRTSNVERRTAASVTDRTTWRRPPACATLEGLRPARSGRVFVPNEHAPTPFAPDPQAAPAA